MKDRMDTVKDSKGMTLIVKTVTRITIGFILLYGIYISLNGDSAPGGGFAGGVIIALSLVHVMLAFGKEVALKRLHSYAMRFSISIASLVFLYVVMIRWHGSYSHIVIPLAEMVIVGAGLFAIFVALVLLSKSDKDSE
ncbi:MAG: MnhB domain-containing protein [Candidatus Omnitrophica bacterium]|nr:MnhB domain-containing protein [Candidatus Omnitrophota bacterium]